MLDRSRGLSVMTGPRAELAISQGTHFATQRLAGHADPKLLPQPLAKIDQTPANNIVDGRDRTTLNDRRQRSPMRVGQSRFRARRLAVQQAIRPLRVEPQHPVPDDLQSDIADARCLTAAAAGFWVHAEGVKLCGEDYALSGRATGSHLDLYNILAY